MNKYERKLEIDVILNQLKDYCIIDKTKKMLIKSNQVLIYYI